MTGTIRFISALSLLLIWVSAAHAQSSEWRFAVSGDSRNCGDVVMPGIAAAVRQSGAKFYWHLGDLRKITSVDEDIAHQPEHLAAPLSKDQYEAIAWDDFSQNQMAPFGEVPFYLGIGNHDTYPPKGHDPFVAQFSRQLDLPNLHSQRLKDDPAALQPQTYYHWIERGVDFFNLDNATKYQFDSAQLDWFEKLLKKDGANSRIHAIVVGMHEALPESISRSHSMDESEGGAETGLRVYNDLLDVRKRNHKQIYVLASHSHYFMAGTFNTAYWQTHGGILPGWIIGTAGAVRYKLPPDSGRADAAMTNVYGFLLATVDRKDRIKIDFQRLDESGVPAAVTARYTPQFVHWCFAENSEAH